MRGERRGFLVDRGLVGHPRCGGLVPLDRLRLAHHRAGEHLVHARDRNDLEPALDTVRDFNKIFGILFGCCMGSSEWNFRVGMDFRVGM